MPSCWETMGKNKDEKMEEGGEEEVGVGAEERRAEGTEEWSGILGGKDETGGQMVETIGGGEMQIRTPYAC